METYSESIQKISKKLLETKLIHIAIGITFIAFIITKFQILAFTTAALIVILLLTEVYVGVSTEGWMKEIKETLIAFAFAVFIWYGVGFILNTSAPLDAIVSCSMLPSLDRGDLVVLQGAFIHAPEIVISEEEWRKRDKDFKSVYYKWAVLQDEEAHKKLLSISTQNFSETDGLITYHFGVCAQKIEGETKAVPCVKSISIKNKTFYYNSSNDIVVYEPLPEDYFARTGAIIHRVFLKIRVNDKVYYLMKGDNNLVFDTQMGNGLTWDERIKGKAILRIPWIGYIKLFLAGSFATPPGCNRILEG